MNTQTGQQQYRKKPVVVEAFQMTEQAGSNNKDWPIWLHQAWQKDNNVEGSLHIKAITPRTFEIKTMEGNHTVTWGDFIIQGVKGEIYPCKPDIFEMTYEPVSTSPINSTGQQQEEKHIAKFEELLKLIKSYRNHDGETSVGNHIENEITEHLAFTIKTVGNKGEEAFRVIKRRVLNHLNHAVSTKQLTDFDKEQMSLLIKDIELSTPPTPSPELKEVELTKEEILTPLLSNMGYGYYNLKETPGFANSMLQIAEKAMDEYAEQFRKSSIPIEVKDEEAKVKWDRLNKGIKEWEAEPVEVKENSNEYHDITLPFEVKEDEGREETVSKGLYNRLLQSNHETELELISEKEWSAKLAKQLEQHVYGNNDNGKPSIMEITTLLNDFNQYKTKK